MRALLLPFPSCRVQVGADGKAGEAMESRAWRDAAQDTTQKFRIVSSLLLQQDVPGGGAEPHIAVRHWGTALFVGERGEACSSGIERKPIDLTERKALDWTRCHRQGRRAGCCPR